MGPTSGVGTGADTGPEGECGVRGAPVLREGKRGQATGPAVSAQIGAAFANAAREWFSFVCTQKKRQIL